MGQGSLPVSGTCYFHSLTAGLPVLLGGVTLAGAALAEQSQACEPTRQSLLCFYQLTKSACLCRPSAAFVGVRLCLKLCSFGGQRSAVLCLYSCRSSHRVLPASASLPSTDLTCIYSLENVFSLSHAHTQSHTSRWELLFKFHYES